MACVESGIAVRSASSETSELLTPLDAVAEVLMSHLTYFAQVSSTAASTAEQLLCRVEKVLTDLNTMRSRDRAKGVDSITQAVREQAGAAAEGGLTVDRSFWLDYFSDSAARGVSLASQRRVMEEASGAYVRDLWVRDDGSHTAALMRLTGVVQEHVSAVQGFATIAYHTFMQRSGRSAEARTAFAEALLEGTPLPELLRKEYLVVVTPSRVEQIEQLALRHESAMSASRGGRSVLLFPVLVDRHESRMEVEELLRGASGSRGRAAAVAEWASEPSRVPAAFERCSVLAELALLAPNRPALMFDEDLRLEQYLLRDLAMSTDLAHPLAELLKHQDLLQTVSRFFSENLDRTATAEALHIDRRTLTSRLQRVAQLTGLDPRTTRGVHVLSNALTAHRLQLLRSERMPIR